MTRMGCVFCDRIARADRVEAHGEWVVSFEPVNPVTVGHRLFVPRRHLMSADSDPLVSGRVFEEAATWAAHRPEDYNLITSSGPVATQTVMHMYVDYLPRRPADLLDLPWSKSSASPP